MVAGWFLNFHHSWKTLPVTCGRLDLANTGAQCSMQKQENYRKPSYGCKKPTPSIGNSRDRQRSNKETEGLDHQQDYGEGYPNNNQSLCVNRATMSKENTNTKGSAASTLDQVQKQKDCFFNHLLSLKQELRRTNPETSPPKTASKPPSTNASTTLVLLLLPHDTTVGFGRGGSSGASPLRQMGWTWRLHTVGGREREYTLESKMIWQPLSKVTSTLCGLCGAI